MTKSKLLKLLGQHNPKLIVIRYYDFKKMELAKLENIVNDIYSPCANDKTFYVCKECTLGDIINSLKDADSVNDYICQGGIHTYRDIYEDLSRITKQPIYMPMFVAFSAKECEEYRNIHKEKILKHKENIMRMFGMYTQYVNELDYFHI